MIKYILAALAVVFTFNANADVRVLKYSDSNRYFIEITGEITRGDYDKFWNIVNNRQGLSDLVDLDSPGGDVWAAQQIANLISSRDMNTRVWKNRMCASACTCTHTILPHPCVHVTRADQVGNLLCCPDIAARGI